MDPQKVYAKDELDNIVGVLGSGHYNFVLIDREIIMVKDENNQNQKSCLNLSLEALGLYTIIKAHAINKTYCFPSIQTLCKLTGKSNKTIHKFLDELFAKGLLLKSKKENEKGGKAHNLYILPTVPKEEIKKRSLNQHVKSTRCQPVEQDVNSTHCKNQGVDSTRDNVENLHVATCKNYTLSKNNISYNNRNICDDFFKKTKLEKDNCSDEAIRYLEQGLKGLLSSNGSYSYVHETQTLYLTGSLMALESKGDFNRFLLLMGSGISIQQVEVDGIEL